MHEFKKGDTIEGYRILSEIGRGAASIIYLVQQPETKQVWALKHVAKGDAKDGRFLDQAEAEYKVAQQLNHPNIRKIVKMIKKKRSLLSVSELMLVMELVDGTSLEKVPPATFEKAVHIFHQTADAMHHMHTRGWVHADMKPNNVVVNAEGLAKIIDLGQSCQVGTVKPRIQGTPDYIAPEQVNREPITPRTDVYNLGATMYWVLTRRHIPTALPKGDSLVRSLDANSMERATPACEINPRIPVKLSDLIMQCVEPEDRKRPTDMKVVSDKLNLIHGILLADQARKAGDFNPLDSAVD